MQTASFARNRGSANGVSNGANSQVMRTPAMAAGVISYPTSPAALRPDTKTAARAGKQSTATLASAKARAGLLPVVGSSHPVMSFLQSVGLTRYGQQFVRGGFDDVDVLFEITLADMQELGIPSIDAFKLIEAIRAAKTKNDCKHAGVEHESAERTRVIAFLEEIGLSQYTEACLRNGFDEMETLACADDEDLRELGFPRGHVIKFRKRLVQHNQQCQSDVASCTPPEDVPVNSGRSSGSVPARNSFLHMAPTERMKSDVERSWEQVKAVGIEVLAERLCAHFFSMVPEAMELFPARVLQKYRDWAADDGSSDDVLDSAAMRKLWAKVVNAVGCSVAGLHDVNRLVPMLRQLGGRHLNYGPTEHYWEMCGHALCYSLRDCLGNDFTTEVEQAWTRTYAFISAVMISGFHEAQEVARNAAKMFSDAQHDDACSARSSIATPTLSSLHNDTDIKLKQEQLDPAP